MQKKHQYLQLSYVILELDRMWKNIIFYINPNNKTSSFITMWSSGNLFWILDFYGDIIYLVQWHVHVLPNYACEFSVI